MLTMEPGEDVAPYHSRQIIPLTRAQWSDWLDPTVPASAVLRALPKGSLGVTQVYPPLTTQSVLLWVAAPVPKRPRHSLRRV